jgi:hypothetical protein
MASVQIDDELMAQVKAKVIKPGYEKGDIKEYIETAIKERLTKETN